MSKKGKASSLHISGPTSTLYSYKAFLVAMRYHITTPVFTRLVVLFTSERVIHPTGSSLLNTEQQHLSSIHEWTETGIDTE